MFKKISSALIIMCFCTVCAKAQLITYSNLSPKYSYKVRLIKVRATDGEPLDTKLKLYIYNNHKKLIQTIAFNTGVLFNGTFTSDTSARSYITGKNKTAEVLDYDFGDLIVADLNFDGKEDIAIKFDSGGNGGPLYNFYLQQADGTFRLDKYLTTYVGSFPNYINIKNKTITTQIHASAYQESRKTFKYNANTKKWHLAKWTMVKDN